MLNRDLKSPNLLLSASWDCKARAHCVLAVPCPSLPASSRSAPSVRCPLASLTLQVADFGLSKLLGQEQAAGSSAEVTNPRWLAPEVLQGQPASLAAGAHGGARRGPAAWWCPRPLVPCRPAGFARPLSG